MKNKLKSDFRNGFTLIEVMVAVVIITLLIGGSLAYFNTFNLNQKVEGAKQELISDLRLARNLAVTRQTPKDFVGVLNYVKVEVVNVGNKTTMNVLANEGGEDSIYFSKDIDPGIKITNENNLRFLVYEGKLIGDDLKPIGVGDTPVFTISSAGYPNDGTQNKTVSVKISGLVDE